MYAFVLKDARFMYMCDYDPGIQWIVRRMHMHVPDPDVYKLQMGRQRWWVCC